MLRVALRILADACFIATLLFAPAGTFYWRRAWTLVAVMLVVRLLTVFALFPMQRALLEERARLPIHRDQSWTDKVLLIAGLTTGFIALPVVAAFDVFHWHIFPRPLPLISNLGLLLFILGWTIQAIALRTNAFATTTVRLQRERAHNVVDTGVYSIIRHPFYAGTALVLIGMALWLESFAAALFGLVPIAVILIRIGEEERFLRRELPGYTQYAVRVPHRLLPGIW
jgi:protein-S-isoprenylcysteine O-methyltransferase Ste14